MDVQMIQFLVGSMRNLPQKRSDTREYDKREVVSAGGIGMCQRSGRPAGKLRTHTVPLQVPKYFTIWPKLTAPRATYPANTSLSLLAIVSYLAEASQAGGTGWSQLKSSITWHVRATAGLVSISPLNFFSLQNNHGGTKVRTRPSFS